MFAHLDPELRVSDEGGDVGGQRRDVPWRRQQSRPTVLDHLRGTAVVDPDNGQPHGHGLEEDHTEGLLEARHSVDVGSGHDLSDVAAFPGEDDPVLDAEVACQLAQLSRERAAVDEQFVAADDQESGIGEALQHRGHGLHQLPLTLPGEQSRHRGKDGSVVGDGKLTTNRRTVDGGIPSGGVEGVEHGVDAASRNAHVGHRPGDVVGDAEHGVGLGHGESSRLRVLVGPLDMHVDDRFRPREAAQDGGIDRISWFLGPMDDLRSGCA